MLASLRCQTPSTRRIAPVPETRTLEKPNARNFLAISALSANRSTELRARVARYRFPWWTVKSPAKLALPKVAVIARTATAFSKMRTVIGHVGGPLALASQPPSGKLWRSENTAPLLSDLAEAGSLRSDVEAD